MIAECFLFGKEQHEKKILSFDADDGCAFSLATEKYLEIESSKKKHNMKLNVAPSLYAHVQKESLWSTMSMSFRKWLKVEPARYDDGKWTRRVNERRRKKGEEIQSCASMQRNRQHHPTHKEREKKTKRKERITENEKR